jgi:hypothetical protein
MANWRQQRGLEVVMLEFREEGRSVGMVAARASAFYRGQREVEVSGRLQSPAMKAPVTRSERGGGFMTELRHAIELRRGASVGVALWCGRRATQWPWRGGARGGGGGATDSGEGGRKGKGA